LTHTAGMNPDEASRICDELHEYVDQGPGENPRVFGTALNALRRLRANVSWDYPLSILMDLEVQFAGWFSPDKWRGTDDGLRSRDHLLNQISRLEDAWDRPRA
jgi:hypothetical protein